MNFQKPAIQTFSHLKITYSGGMSDDSERLPPSRPRLLDFWEKGQVWFRDWIHGDRPWGDETLLDALPESALGSYGVKVGEYVKLDGQSYEPGQIVLVESREELRQLVGGMGKVEGLIFPWLDRVVPPGLWLPHLREIDFVAYRKQHGQRFVKSLAITAGLALLGFYRPEFLMIALLAAVFFGLFPLVDSAMAWCRRVDRLSVSDLNSQLVNNELFQIWISNRPTFLLKLALGILVLVFAAQFYVDKGSTALSNATSLQAAALVRDSVLSGDEWWRTVTAGLMHGSIPHILFNGMALFSLGRVIVALVSPSLLSIVFLVSVITGSLASLAFGHADVSVGASGGILGLLGFLLVVTHKFRRQLPGYLQSSLIQSTIVVAIFGLLGARFIDNAAHAGGLIGGVILGLICYRWLRLAPVRTRPLVAVLGWASLAVLVAGVVKIGVEIWPG
ncbi:MAG: rhomboid family intramembrane serine protease [Verrucomicrobiales bacterium]|nr:rhomboid family intramembrane serine protease [Verrucomicrobiales bacterium]